MTVSGGPSAANSRLWVMSRLLLRRLLILLAVPLLEKLVRALFRKWRFGKRASRSTAFDAA